MPPKKQSKAASKKEAESTIYNPAKVKKQKNLPFADLFGEEAEEWRAALAPLLAVQGADRFIGGDNSVVPEKNFVFQALKPTKPAGEREREREREREERGREVLLWLLFWKIFMSFLF